MGVGSQLLGRLGFRPKEPALSVPEPPARALSRMATLSVVEVLDYAETAMVHTGRALDEMRHGVTPPEVGIPEARRGVETLWAAVRELEARAATGTL